MLQETFALILDWQTKSEAHYVVVFATFSNEDGLGYGSARLALSPFENEVSQGVDQHINFL